MTFVHKKTSPIASRCGVSLLEAVLYIGLVAVIVAAGINMALAMNAAFRAAGATRALARAGEDALERVTRELRLARGVQNASVFSANPAVLALETVASPTDDATAVKTVSAAGGRLYVETQGGSREYLTPPAVSVLLFSAATSTTARATAVRLELILQAGNGRYAKEAAFAQTAVLRGSY